MRLFTLVELMIVVATVGLLAAIAIPNFAEMQLRAKKAEPLVNVPALADAVLLSVETGAISFAVEGMVAPRPVADLDKSAVPWTDLGDADWQLVDWQPDGAVRCTYSFGVGFLEPTQATAVARCDLDHDSVSWRPWLVSSPISAPFAAAYACSSGDNCGGGPGTLDSGSCCH